MLKNELTSIQKTALGDCVNYLLTRLAESKQKSDLTVPLPGSNGQIAGSQSAEADQRVNNSSLRPKGKNGGRA